MQCLLCFKSHENKQEQMLRIPLHCIQSYFDINQVLIQINSNSILYQTLIYCDPKAWLIQADILRGGKPGCMQV